MQKARVRQGAGRNRNPLPKVYQSDFDNYVLSGLKEEAAFKNMVITPSSLIQGVALANSADSYEFDFVASNRNSEFPDRKLIDKDVFVATKWALCLAVVNTTKKGAEVLRAYANKEELAALADITNGADLEALYRGILRCQIDQTEHITDYFTGNFKHVPETYREVANLNLTEDSYQGVPGLHQMPIGLVLNGLRENRFTLKLPKFSSAPEWQTSAANTEVTAFLYLGGFLIKSGAQANYNKVRFEG